MSIKIKAKFESTDKAEYAASKINEQYPDIPCDVTALYDITGYYGYCTVIPSVNANANYLSGVFCPVFPENATSEEVSRVSSALLQIKCSPENSEELGRFILSCGGKITD